MGVEATFEIEITPTEALLPTTSRFDFAKVWEGAAQGVSKGVMVSGGDASSGTAGYVAMEVFEGTLDGRKGAITFQQFGTMQGGVQEVRYEIVPGSGSGELEDLTGTLHLEIDGEGLHHITFELG
ncbi:DUF3224 domain-containing protein [Tessaracoccus sp. MC1756]|uniref:DUF3224 domain-containing protein n=1 Tax=Tessaracoccus sp. MC1756 TaxID=2760311 RepID=UPI0016032172|nr:DUF3224 domain-containing protein [Tessaracoccus sp. MC1756]MBB1510796.1 DUF3224 domain-containing protein [Tessaracoccus sp. MC1756]